MCYERLCLLRKKSSSLGWSRQMDEFSAYSKHLFLLTKCRPHYFPPAERFFIFKLSHHQNSPVQISFLTTIPTGWYSCPFGRARGLFPIKGRYSADQRSYKQEFQSTQQERLFLVESDDLHFCLLVFQKWGMEIFQ